MLTYTTFWQHEYVNLSAAFMTRYAIESISKLERGDE